MTWQGKKIHFVGIKGSGVSGLSILLKADGAVVSGSDTSEKFPSEAELEKNGIKSKEFSKDNVTEDLDLLIFSSAWKEDNVERIKAGELGIRELSYAQALAEYSYDKEVIVITGTHGKTTTTALVGELFEQGGLDPSVLTGDAVKSWGSSIRAGKGTYFIVEGDEYQEKFKLFSPKGIVIPSLDYDHPDYFKNKESYLDSFRVWIKENSSAVFITTKEVNELLGTNGVMADDNDMEIFSKAKYIMPGEAYKNNALLAIRLARIFEIPREKLIMGLNSFKGVGRRLDYYTKDNGDLIIIYDYAHHPEEIKSTLKALRDKYSKYKIVAIFQPHTYTRTKIFLDEFAKSFSDADEIYFQDIYASAREKQEGVTIEDLIEATKKYNPNAARYTGFDPKNFSTKTLFVFMGAGDIWQEAKKISATLPT